MARKPMHVEMVGGKSPRQRMWEAMRKKRVEFDQETIARLGKVEQSMVRDYIRSLLSAHMIKVVSETPVNNLCVKRTYALIVDVGVEAPRLTRDGREVSSGSSNDAMWGTLRRMFKAEAVDYRQLAAFASTAKNVISEGTAKSYVLTLSAAGYLECVQAAVKGQKAAPARYRLRPEMDSGRRAPMIQRTKQVFDPNLNKVMWTEHVEVADE